jgi:Kef-type K+ transport system membrane component KefB/mannitol/fructose-specific phosphotransferase system IIA component (Ntr-type)
MTASEVTLFLLSISIMLFFAKLLGEVFVKLNQSAVTGEILAGIILGPTILGAFFPDIYSMMFPDAGNLKTALDGIILLALIVLLLLSGIEVDLPLVFRLRSSTILTSLTGLLLPVILIFVIVYTVPSLLGAGEGIRMITALIISSAIAISSFPVVAKLLVDLNIFKTQTGLVIISSAMLNDIAGWLLFAFVIGIAGASPIDQPFLQTVIFIFIFIMILMFTGRKLSNRIIPVIQDRFSFPGSILNFIMIIGFLSAAVTHFAGVHALLGAFVAGIALGDSVHLKEKTREIIQQFITNIFAPLFFVSLGLRINLIEHFDVKIVIILLLLTFIGKGTGSALGAWLSGLSKDESAAAGSGISSGSTMGVIVGYIAFQAGLINAELFTGLLLMAIISSFAGAPLMKFFMDKQKYLSFAGLLDADLILFTDKKDKTGIIKELVDAAAAKYPIDKKAVLAELLIHETDTGTGIVNYLAVPYARTTLKKPVMAAAVNKTGLDFSSFDDLPSRIIVLLLTPVKEHGLQLKLLADTAGRFRDRKKAERILDIKDKDELISYLRKL